jgi:hypothetical protein
MRKSGSARCQLMALSGLETCRRSWRLTAGSRRLTIRAPAEADAHASLTLACRTDCHWRRDRKLQIASAPSPLPPPRSSLTTGAIGFSGVLREFATSQTSIRSSPRRPSQSDVYVFAGWDHSRAFRPCALNPGALSMKSRMALMLLGVVSLSLSSLPAFSADGSKPIIVPHDVVVYGEPGDESTKQSAFLKGGSQIKLFSQRSDNWCHVRGGKDPAPRGQGWIWCGMGDDGKNYSVKKVAAEKPVTDMQVVEAKFPEGMEIEVKGPPTLICREKLADGTTKCTNVTVADGKLVFGPMGGCPAM